MLLPGPSAVKVYALLSFFDEDPETLYSNVRSYGKIADHVIAVDGRYAHFPSPVDSSPDEQHDAIRSGCIDGNMGLTVHRNETAWVDGEVEKRAFMFKLALERAHPMRDWFIIVDGDVSVASVNDGWRDVLSASTADVGNVTVENRRIDNKVMNAVAFRAMYRALPGLTCKFAHHYYLTQVGGVTRWLWHTPACRLSDEPCVDLTEHVTVHHRNLDRGADRAWASRMYYRKRDELQLERAPRW